MIINIMTRKKLYDIKSALAKDLSDMSICYFGERELQAMKSVAKYTKRS